MLAFDSAGSLFPQRIIATAASPPPPPAHQDAGAAPHPDCIKAIPRGVPGTAMSDTAVIFGSFSVHCLNCTPFFFFFFFFFFFVFFFLKKKKKKK
jgi:hypothetical protein